MSETSLSYVTLQDGTGTATAAGQQFRVRAEYAPGALSYALHMVPEIGGAAWGLTNPAPMSIVVGGAVVGGSGAPLNVRDVSPAVTDESGSNQLVPTAVSANGTSLGPLPSWAKGLRFYLGTGDALSFFVGFEQMTTPPTAAVSISGNQMTGTGPNWDEPLAPGQVVYVTAVSGSPKFRFVA